MKPELFSFFMCIVTVFWAFAVGGIITVSAIVICRYIWQKGQR